MNDISEFICGAQTWGVYCEFKVGSVSIFAIAVMYLTL